MFSKAALDKWLRVSVRRQLLDADLELVSQHMKGTVLEIGCGRNSRRGEFRPPVVEGQWTFVDLNRNAHPHFQGDTGSLPLKNVSFDVVVCLEVLEYVEEPKNAIREIKRVLKNGGALILALPFLHRMDTPADYWRITETGLKRMLAEAGFRVKQFYAQGVAPSVVANILKFAASSQQSQRKRMLAGFFVRPLCAFLQWWDALLVKSNPLLSSFSTGYLLLAVANQGKK